MVGTKNKLPMKTKQDQNNTPEALYWIGLQFIQRARGTNEIIMRSFPFWGPTLDWAIHHAKQTNKLSKEEKSNWTHVIVHSQLKETPDGFERLPIDITEHKI